MAEKQGSQQFAVLDCLDPTARSFASASPDVNSEMFRTIDPRPFHEHYLRVRLAPSTHVVSDAASRIPEFVPASANDEGVPVREYDLCWDVA